MSMIRVIYVHVLAGLSACSALGTIPLATTSFDRSAAVDTFKEHVAALSEDRMQGCSPASLG
ncbi:MAG: hypothetical protein AAGH76_14360 [Pseudomonadota bacterium]